jgi:16S rRNA (cytosine1402-N4)-methyltransferase
MNPPSYHSPVLVDAVLEALTGAKRVVDGTAGGGGHVQRLVEAGMSVLAVDRDPDAIAVLTEKFQNTGLQVGHGEFDSPEILARASTFGADAVLLDLGVSSHQLDDDSRGFTFRAGAKLDMRMGGHGSTAADFLNNAPGDELRTTFKRYGDERKASRLAREIERRRSTEAFSISDHFVNAIRAVLGPSSGPADFARLFQAVRIVVNDELGRLERALTLYRDVLPDQGVVAVITYHSGEDRIAKHAFREWARSCVCPEGMPVCQCRGKALGERLNRKPILASEAEIATNPRARSAKLRAFRVTAQ